MSSTGKEFLGQLFTAIDSMASERFAAFLTEDAVFHFGSAPPVRGKSAIEAAVATFFSSIAGCRHTLRASWSGVDSLVCEGRVCYTRKDGSEINLPFADVFELRGELIAAYRIYIDIAPLFDPQAADAAAHS
jgi:ketosteroid isomerase-like protein